MAVCGLERTLTQTVSATWITLICSQCGAQELCGSLLAVNFWCSEPSQPLGMITSGLKETFIKRHIIERTNKVEIRPEEQSEKTEELSGKFMK